MKFSATEAQLRDVAALAYNASQPMGMGFLHYVAGDVSGDDLGHIDVSSGLNFDYVQGRMMKLYGALAGGHRRPGAGSPPTVSGPLRQTPRAARRWPVPS